VPLVMDHPSFPYFFFFRYPVSFLSYGLVQICHHSSLETGGGSCVMATELCRTHTILRFLSTAAMASTQSWVHELYCQTSYICQSSKYWP
jgi:hypothetical protein